MKLCLHLKKCDFLAAWQQQYFLYYAVSIAPVCVLLGSFSLIFMQLEPSMSGTEYFSEWRSQAPTLTYYMKLVSDYGNPLFYVVYACIAFVSLKKSNKSGLRLVFYYLLFQFLITFLLGHFFKVAIGKSRPFHGVGYEPFSLSSKYHSAVSGHVADISSSALPLSMVWRKLTFSFILGLMIALMAFSRVYLGKHYLADLWAGLFIGSCSAILTVIFWHKWSLNNEQRS